MKKPFWPGSAPHEFSTRQRRAVAVDDVDAGEQHRVGHARFAVFQPRGFVEVERHVVQRFEVVQIAVHQAHVAPHLLADVAAEPDRLASLERALGDALHQAHLDVQIGHALTADHVAQVLHGIRPPGRVRRPRVVHQAHVVVQRQVDELRRELPAASCRPVR